MTLVLEYAPPRAGLRWDSIPSSVTLVLLAYAHLSLCWFISDFLLVPTCEMPNHDFLTWTPVAWLPGSTAILWTGPAVGAIVMCLMSVIAGRLMQQLLLKYHNGFHGNTALFLRDGQVWIAAILWLGWIRVPALIAFVYQFSHWAIRSTS